MMGFSAAWSMAVGGKVGGGVFSVLGVFVEVAAGWAWLSTVIGGCVALATSLSYAHLARSFGAGGGRFSLLRHHHHERFAGLPP